MAHLNGIQIDPAVFCPEQFKVNISNDCPACPGNAQMWAGLSSALHSCI
jgi:hypothetical protein